MVHSAPTNAYVGARLREAADLLAAQGADVHRVAAYRRAADGVRGDPRDVARLFDEEGVKGLDAIPGVGLGIAAAIAEMLVTQRWSLLERLRHATATPVLLQSVPGIGSALATRIHDELHAESLEDLALAAGDGRLERLAGVGPRRAQAIGASVAAMLGRLRAAPAVAGPALPPVATLLEIDRDYRDRAWRGSLRLVAPRRNNPEGRAWLPILHATRGPWHFTALYSNTALAHRLGHARDWVVLFFYDGDHVERQCTVVTERRGPLAGMRVVRGREPECAVHYQGRSQPHEEHA